ncbi:GGDEF domain-containing protein [Shewanella woodyi]|uniref:Diguanylate cyclase/phosphodiesterase n=1 Tax=Shewanella woodyi (strain ATCC 51908 / MS32) TaxID=392500 RepID=B1KJC6_SHEWM|nr:GGDEF domain-containing protein [Shewanella woodyi]ACA88598.1 diguanylate cyclase/phosphodiesterase [Shewanella woodyi ATCC 51908]
MSAIDLGKELNKVIEKKQITALFQPIFNINNHSLHGYEALSRGPAHSPLYSPVPLFQTAENQGKLSELEGLCRSISINQFKTKRLAGKLFINISPKALLEPNHAKGMTLSLVQELGLSPSQVVIELSEQYPADDIDMLKSCLNHYRNQGFLTAIDDLGTGYSGLRLWSELAPDYVKIDRHFINQIDQSTVKQEFVRSIIELCQNLTCQVIAEGIETQEELAILKQLGIVYCQGYLLGMPDKNPNGKIEAHIHQDPVKKQIRYAESAESLCNQAETASSETKLKQLSDIFIAQPSLQSIVILVQSKPQGLVSRAQLLELFSTPYGRALHENRIAIEVMNTQVVTVDAASPISLVSQSLTAQNSSFMAQEFIIMRHGKLLGIGHTKDLLQLLTEQRIKLARHANPLSGLPGNIPIQEEIKRLKQQKKPFYLAYFDLNNFKPYNDIYGFCRGDEVILEVSGILESHHNSDNFIGHVGGDDFVIISTSQNIQSVCQQVLIDFDQKKRLFYSNEHWQARKMQAEDRLGQACEFDLIGLCVGLLSPAITSGANAHELSIYSADAKKQAKKAVSSFSLL